MRRLPTYFLAATAFVAVCGRLSAQDFNPVDPWPTPSAPPRTPVSKRDPTIRKASLVEALDHKKKLAEAKPAAAVGLREAVIIDEPADAAALPAAMGPVPVDPSLTPIMPPPSVGAAIMPIPTSTIHKTMPAPPPTVPVVIAGPPIPGTVVEPGPVLGPNGEPVACDPAIADPGLEGTFRYLPGVADALPGPYFELGVTTLQRISWREETVAVTRFDGTHVFELESRDFTTGFAPGVRFLMGWPVGCGWYVESVFYGLNEWEASRTLNGPLARSLSTFPEIGTFTALQANFRATLNNAEVNAKWAVAIFPTSYVHFGFRSLFLEERLAVAETGTARVNGGSVNAVGVTDILARNRIFGPQIGYETRWNGPYGRFSFDSFVKAGFGWNWERVEVTRSLSNSSVGPVAVSRDATDDDGTAWLEVQTAATFHFTPTIALRAGWQFLSIWGFAAAPLQRPWGFFDDHQGFDVDSSERAVYQGPFASLEITWGGLRY